MKQYVNTRVQRVQEHGVIATDTTSGEEVEIPCDYVVMAVGSRKKRYGHHLRGRGRDPL